VMLRGEERERERQRAVLNFCSFVFVCPTLSRRPLAEDSREKENFFVRAKKEKKRADDELMFDDDLMSQHGAVKKKVSTTTTLVKTHTLAHKKTENSNDGGGCGAHWRQYFRERRLAFVVVVVGRGDDAKFEKTFE
jgi:hypothetical protein